MEQLEKMLLSNPEMKRKVKTILSNVLRKARAEVSSATHAMLENDPRAAYKAVKHTVYKRILGGSISILPKRKASNTRVKVLHHSVYEDEPWHRGGNRRKRSQRTEQIDSYYGSDRGFILRFLNSGTKSRDTRYGNRGSITAKNWFGRTSRFYLEKYAEYFCDLIDQEIKNVLKHGNN